MIESSDLGSQVSSAISYHWLMIVWHNVCRSFFRSVITYQRLCVFFKKAGLDDKFWCHADEVYRSRNELFGPWVCTAAPRWFWMSTWMLNIIAKLRLFFFYHSLQLASVFNSALIKDVFEKRWQFLWKKRVKKGKEINHWKTWWKRKKRVQPEANSVSCDESWNYDEHELSWP